MMIVGGCDARWMRGASPPSSATSSSWMMLITSWVGLMLCTTSSVRARTLTDLMKSRATR